MTLNGSRYFEFGEKSEARWGKLIKDFLLSLPRPSGIFCTNDTVAVEVISMASRLGIDMPKDMLVVGVDDVEEFCEILSPTLTSVHPAFADAGLSAANLLARRLAPSLRF